MKIKLVYSLLTVFIIAAVASTSCKKYADPPPYFEDDLDTTSGTTSRRVLLIGIDGAVSSEIKAIAPPTITAMLSHSKYQWDAVTDEVSTDAASWKTLVSGVSYSRHKILDSTFIYSPPAGDDTHGGAPAFFPSMFSYILSSASKNNMRTSFISSWPTLVERVVPEVLDPVITTGDQGVKDSAITRIKNNNPEFMVLHFNSPSIAGKAGGFTQANTGYKDAITKIDGYIGEIMTALKARPEYNKNEEWLVIVTNTHGGIDESYGGTTPDETTGFMLHFNERFGSVEFTKEGSFISPLLTGNQGSAIKAILSDPNAYNPGSAPTTIELKVRGSKAAGSYPPFFTKSRNNLVVEVYLLVHLVLDSYAGQITAAGIWK
ncbi:alkaline phosphatase family protein [Niabella ginsengisoli]|uniref:Alkaline phosphatase family protein n=1 Tax=Niabella ginsengisoli TaxID=522298 RepID=A0ABS9SG24_9BACT|nr:alkaline phosphatase family protein [Niabella ginsengisoli]MCH5597299.1 alkaline phosphatase family protein [Niabella ginsengisoli]